MKKNIKMKKIKKIKKNIKIKKIKDEKNKKKIKKKNYGKFCRAQWVYIVLWSKQT